MLEPVETPWKRFIRATELLRRGAYEEGWPLYEARTEVYRDRLIMPGADYPKWDGSPVRSLLLFPEQGLGDQIMFARYLPELRARGIDVTVLCSPSLVRLFAAMGARALPASGEVNVPRHEAWSLVGSLPHLIGTVPTGPYLPSAKDGEGVGVMTRGNPKHSNDAHRSLPPDCARHLLRLGRSLHPDDTGVRDMLDTADIISKLSLVISVDTSVAHLSGAMGKPTWLLVPHHGADWRWGLADRAIWYPSMRIFRQPAPGRWDLVVEQLLRLVR